MLLRQGLRRPPHIDLARHRVGDQRRAILPEGRDHLVGLGNEGVDLRAPLVEELDDLLLLVYQEEGLSQIAQGLAIRTLGCVP